MPEVDVNDLSPTIDKLSEPSTPNECNDDEISKCETMVVENGIEDDEKEEKEDKENEWTDILDNGQLLLKVIRKGEPDARPQNSDICTIKLVGRLDDGRVVEEFNSLRIHLGDYEVVHGLELALLLMNLHDEAMVKVAPRFAYGTLGNPPDVPPDATITYTVELLNVEMKPELETISYNERKEMANSKRERGNWWYSRQDATKAVQCYRNALDILDENIVYVDETGNSIPATEAIINNLIQEKLKVFNNLAAAQLMLEAYESALSSVNEVIKRDPDNVKALFRKSKILTAKGHINEAVNILKKAFLLQPENNAVRMELSRCVKLQQIEKQHEKNLYKKMLGQNKKEVGDVAISKGRSNLWTKVLGTAATATLLAAIAVAVSYKFKNYPFV